MLEKFRKSNDVVLATPPPISHRTAEENLGLGYLASVLRKSGREVRIIDGWLRGMTSHQLAEEILMDPPTVFLGFACYRSNMERTMEVASILKTNGLNVPLIVGGFGPTFNTDEFLSAGFDIAVRGEAEQTILEIADHFAIGLPELKDIQGISFRENGETKNNFARKLINDLDELPFPDRETMKLAIQRRTPVHVISSRGCEAHCVFCSVVAFQRLSEGSQWRQRSIQNFVEELQQLNKDGARFFKVVDDSLIEPPRDGWWCKQLADEIESRGLRLRLRGSIRADRVTEDVVRELKRAGFFAFSCGIENGSVTALKRMGKSASLEQNIKALEMFQKHGIYIQAGHILFDYGTTIQELEENYDFLSKYKWTISKGIFTEMYAADGTRFTRLLQKRGLLAEDEKGLGNNTYPVLDKEARKVYFALKTWQKSHSKIYDMTIDAISAPKALEPEELALFHPLCIRLKEKDLIYMRNVLDIVKNGASEQQVEDFVEKTISETQEWNNRFRLEVSDAYSKTGLVYDAEENPFLT